MGGYNRGWLDPGSAVMRVHGEPRTSFLTTSNGQPPPRKGGGAAQANPRGMARSTIRKTARSARRCIIGFGRNAGPPMLPNGFYNNNYQFLQTKDAFVIEVEMGP